MGSGASFCLAGGRQGEVSGTIAAICELQNYLIIGRVSVKGLFLKWFSQCTGAGVIGKQVVRLTWRCQLKVIGTIRLRATSG